MSTAQIGAWRVTIAAADLAAALEPVLAALARGEEPPEAERVKRSRVREVLRLPLAGGEAFVKWSRREPRRPFASSAARELRNLERVRRAGVAAVEPLAAAERHAGGRRESLLVTRAAPGATPVEHLLRGLDSVARAALLARAAGLARRLHDARLWHRDLHAGNLLASGAELWLVDLQKLRALPFAPPPWLRARDLVWLVSDGRLGVLATPREIARAYVATAPGGPEPERFARLVARAAANAARARLASRERRCVSPSTGFRCETRGMQRVWRRADVTTHAVLEAAEKTRGAEAALASFAGGPPPGPAPDPFARGQGGAEPGAPAVAPALARAFGAGPALAKPLAFAHPGLRAWRLAHALLLRGVDTPAPLALVEWRQRGWVSRSLLVTRVVPDAVLLAAALGARPERAPSAGAGLARAHATGAALAGAQLALHGALPPGDSGPADALVALRPEGARIRRTLSPARAERDLTDVASTLGPREREAFVAGYREAARS